MPLALLVAARGGFVGTHGDEGRAQMHEERGMEEQGRRRIGRYRGD